MSGRERKRKEKKNERGQQTYQHSLQLTHRLMLHRLSIDFAYLVAHMQRGLSVYHATVHDACHNAASVLGHFQRDALQSTKQRRGGGRGQIE